MLCAGKTSIDPKDEHKGRRPSHTCIGGSPEPAFHSFDTDPHRDGFVPGKWAADDDDVSRVNSLRRLGIMMTTSEPAFDRMTKIASELFKVPICLVSFVAEDFQWFKAREGLDADRTGRDVSFCSYATLKETQGVFAVENAHLDLRFKDNPLVTGPPHIAFYAGAPIYHPDVPHKIGSFCIIDNKPRSITDHEKYLLSLFAAQITHELLTRATMNALAEP